MPSTAFVPGVQIESLPVVEADGFVWLWLGQGTPPAVPEFTKPPSGFQVRLLPLRVPKVTLSGCMLRRHAAAVHVCKLFACSMLAVAPTTSGGSMTRTISQQVVFLTPPLLAPSASTHSTHTAPLQDGSTDMHAAMSLTERAHPLTVQRQCAPAPASPCW